MKKSYLKTIIVMSRYMLIILLANCMFATMMFAADNAQSQGLKDVNISVKVDNLKLSEVFDLLESQTPFTFSYAKNDMPLDKRITVRSKNESLYAVLSQIARKANVNFRRVNNQIAVKPGKSPVAVLEQPMAQGRAITGRVTSSEDNDGLPGVNVIVKGTAQGTITDLDGNYKINVPSDETVLEYSYVGYQKEEVVVGEKSIINVVLPLDVRALNEVVVTALGIKREEKALGYAVQKISGENLQKVAGTDVATSLTGKIAGVLVQNSTDFNVEPKIEVRGENPLIVIDGVAYSNKKLNDIAAEDIESINVLKGATASALYGFRGQSGAILITTKNGSSDKLGVTVDVSSNTMFNAGFLAIPKKQSVYGRGTAYVYDINSDQSWGTFMDGSTQTQWDPIAKEFRDYPYLPVGKDNFKNFLEPGYVTNNNLSVAFKADKAALRSSVNWTENKGRYPNSVVDKFTYTLGGDINLDKFKLSSNMSYARRKSPNMGSNGYTSYDPMYSLLIWSSADFNILDYKDNYWLKPGQLQNNQFGYHFDTDTYTGKNQNDPYFDRYEKTNEVSRDIFNADLTAGYDITDWLNATVRTGLDFYTDRGQIRISQGSYTSSGNTSIPGNPYTWNGTRTGAYMSGQTQGFSINSDLLLTGSKKLVNNKLDIEYLAGGTIFYDRDDNINAGTVGGISIPGYFSLNASVNPASVGESTVARQVNSLFGRLALSWNGMFYLDFTGRDDWVSMLANPEVPKSDRSYIYPSVSGSFVLSELLPESINSWLDLLKVRGSWAQAKTAPAPYAINSVFTVNPGTWNDQNGASAPGALYLNTYSPNSTATTEVGLQAMILNRRLTADATYYSKRIFDILTKGPLSSATGYTGIYLNTNEERSRRGWEIAVTGTPIKRGDVQWDISLNWSAYKEVYTKLDSLYSTKKPWIKEGNRTDDFTVKDYLRVPDGQYAGQFIYNSSGRIMRSNYYTLYGYSNPDWIWGVNSTFRYKNFSLYMSFDGVVGGLISTRTESYMWQAGVHPNSVTKERELDVSNPGSKNYVGKGVQVVSGDVTFDTDGNITSDSREYAPNDVPSTYKQAMIDLHNTSAWGSSANPNDVYAGTFLKLRELSLTYTVPDKFLNELGGGFIKNASIGFVGQNVWFWAKDFKYSDPDGGKEDFADPSVRYLGGNIKLTF